VLTFIAAGSVTIHADQAGDASFNAAPRVTRVFCVNPAKPTITAAGMDTENPILTSSSATGNQWFLNDVAITSAINSTHTVAAAGVYKVQATIGGCSSVFSNNHTFVITGDLPGTASADISVFPNPVSDRLFISVPGAGRKLISIHTVNGVRRDVQETGEREAQFDVRSYSEGVYFVRISTENSVRLVRFIKN
jgi:hypothetical protein